MLILPRRRALLTGAAAIAAYAGLSRPARASATTWNPADTSASITLSNGNLTSQHNYIANGGWASARATQGYSGLTAVSASFECAWPDPLQHVIGVGTLGATLANYAGSGANGYGYYTAGGLYYNGSPMVVGAPATGNPVFLILVHWGWKKLWIGSIGFAIAFWGDQVSWNPATNSGGFDISAVLTSNSVALYPMVSAQYASDAAQTTNFGATPFVLAAHLPVGWGTWDAPNTGATPGRPVLING